MSANSPFHHLYNNFLQAVRDADKSLEIESHFGANKSKESMFEYFWSLEEAHQHLDFNMIDSFKSESQANQLREEGNAYYQKGQLDQALELYNICVMYAPSPFRKEHVKEINERDSKEQPISKSLAYGFANRSAVLFQLGKYGKSIQDIDLAIKYGYPSEQIFKLVERKAKCLLELENKREAKTLIYSTIEKLSTLNMDEPNKRTKRNKLLSLLNKLQQGQENSEPYSNNIENGIDKNRKNSKLRSKDILPFNCNSNTNVQNDIPRLGSENSTIPSVSSALSLQYTNEQGRFVVADRDIKPGELILVEKSPYTVLHQDLQILSSHCCVCLIRTYNPLPCHCCNMVMFCSETCQAKTFNGHNDIECLTLATLESLHTGTYPPLAFKVITEIPYRKLKRLIPETIRELAESSPAHYGFNKKGIFDSSDFLTTFAMIDNLSKRDVDDLFKNVMVSFILTKLLIKSNKYFIDETGSPFHPSDEEVILVGSTFLALIMSFQCNAHQIEELNTMDHDVPRARGVGAAVFPAQSLLNHSCNPGTVRSTIGSYMTSYAIRFIPKGSEVTDSYGCHYMIHDAEYRLSELKKKYFFNCMCEACTEGWTQSEIQSTNIKFKSDKDADYMIKYKELRAGFQKAYFNIKKGDLHEENKQVFIDLIEFLDRYVIFPCKMYHNVQELLKFCIDKEILTIKS